MDLLLLSNVANYGRAPLEHARDELSDLVAGRMVTFIGFARKDVGEYNEQMSLAFQRLGVTASGLQATSAACEEVRTAECIYVGGGNTFRLLNELHRLNLISEIRERIRCGVPYISDSAGSIVAGPSICVSNDMPIVAPQSFDALHLTPFQINPHYVPGTSDTTHMGETRDERIFDYLNEEDRVVVALREGAWVRTGGGIAVLGGEGGGRIFQRGKGAIDVDPDVDMTKYFTSR